MTNRPLTAKEQYEQQGKENLKDTEPAIRLLIKGLTPPPIKWFTFKE